MLYCMALHSMHFVLLCAVLYYLPVFQPSTDLCAGTRHSVMLNDLLHGIVCMVHTYGVIILCMYFVLGCFVVLFCAAAKYSVVLNDPRVLYCMR